MSVGQIADLSAIGLGQIGNLSYEFHLRIQMW